MPLGLELDLRAIKPAQVLEQLPVAAGQVLLVLQLVAHAKGPGEINHVHFPAPADQYIGEVTVGIIHQLGENSHPVHLLVPLIHVGRLSFLLDPLRLVHHHVVDPPGERTRPAAPFALHRDGHHAAQPDQLGQLVGRNIIVKRIAKIHLRVAVGELHHGFSLVDRLE